MPDTVWAEIRAPPTRQIALLRCSPDGRGSARRQNSARQPGHLHLANEPGRRGATKRRPSVTHTSRLVTRARGSLESRMFECFEASYISLTRRGSCPVAKVSCSERTQAQEKRFDHSWARRWRKAPQHKVPPKTGRYQDAGDGPSEQYRLVAQSHLR